MLALEVYAHSWNIGNRQDTKMKILKIIIKVLVGLIFGIGTAFALLPLSASLPENIGVILSYAGAGIVLLLCIFAPTIRRAFGRGFLLVGAAVFILPISTFFLSGAVITETVNEAAEGTEGMTALGGIAAGGLMTGLAMFVGFFLGGVLLLTGLILSLGGKKEVIVVGR